MDDHTKALIDEQRDRIAAIDRLLAKTDRPAVRRGLTESRQDALELIRELSAAEQ